MSLRVLKEIVYIAMGDEIFRRKVIFQPDEWLPKYDLTSAELMALRLGDKKKLIDLGLEEYLATYAEAMLSRRR
ncbi:MAG: hypothetical protein HXX08_20040 [Chloroflexi bacterium]|jgi:hypothetical protein|uniref:Extradiol ring-cleavage dioxygenase LigAB LigA subunit domain-containing protein n=1 Tax=Candidatus Chlorohelix allophototropha TaxID=3003348 RepID=A0A8T7M819_9CHLR|nr:hypothetical protein [Chloroflexota bacterium]WJW68090.1 hypothetical protein OZ401_003691 [Chloroflexota bacterium L227-S17]